MKARWFRVLSEDADELWARGAVAVEHGCGHFVSFEDAASLGAPVVEGAPDWAEEWLAQHAPVRVSDRIVVAPSWVHAEAPVLLRIDPGLAFGTGTHPTTFLCLQLLEELLRPGMRVLDFGAGSGILAIAALKLGAAAADVVEIDPIALRAAERNARRHRVALGRASGTYDLVLANLPVEAQPGLERRLAPGGWLISSGFLEEPPRFAELELAEERRRSGWSAAVLRKPPSSAR